MARCYITATFMFLIFLNEARGQILDKSQFEEGSQFTATCDAAVVKLDKVFTNVHRVILSQHNGIETRDIGELFSGLRFVDPTVSVNANIGPNWFIATPTIDEIKTAVQNRNTRTVMKIVASNTKAKCSDGQMYKCVVKYFDEQYKLQDAVVEENMTAMAGANLVDMIPDPDNSRFGSRVSGYSDNETLTMKCTAKGPEDYAFQWRRKCPSKFNVQPYFVVWPVQNDIQTTVKTLSLDSNGQPNDCNLYLHRQDLKFQTELDLNDCIIECQFGIARTFSSSFMEKDSMNFTIQVSLDGTTPGTGGSASSASNDGLAIGLGIGLTLLVIIIIAILLYVFWFQKRNKNSKYTDEEKDRPDNGNANAPPLVFYSKPHKPPQDDEKDEMPDGMTNAALDVSHDSNNSENRGPPRYANSPDGQGPPHYNPSGVNSLNRDPYDMPDHPPFASGENNRGYSEDPDGGHKYQRGRAKSNRSDRLSRTSSRDLDDVPDPQDYDNRPRYAPRDPPRSRNHSTDDGTDFRDYGDPNMGTAI